MKTYHKIHNIYKRDGKDILHGVYSQPEFEYLAYNEWEFTEKVDGTNIRVMWKDGELTFGGKTDNAAIPARLFTALTYIFPAKKFREQFEGDVCLYGEGYGAKIQKGGGNYRSDQGFVLFDVRVGDWWLRRKDVEEIAQRVGLDIVPVVGRGTLNSAIGMVTDGFNSHWGEFTAEGIVARPVVPLLTRSGERIITKIKCRDFQ